MKHIITNPKKGFTLLEIMVVIAIIGLLTAVGVVGYTTIQQRGRDTRRIVDIKSLQNAQEQYYSLNDSEYHSFSGCSVTGIINTVTDPQPGQNYTCATATDLSAYIACAPVEDSSKANASAASCGATSCTINTGGTLTLYCLGNLQ